MVNYHIIIPAPTTAMQVHCTMYNCTHYCIAPTSYPTHSQALLQRTLHTAHSLLNLILFFGDTYYLYGLSKHLKCHPGLPAWHVSPVMSHLLIQARPYLGSTCTRVQRPKTVKTLVDKTFTSNQSYKSFSSIKLASPFDRYVKCNQPVPQIHPSFTLNGIPVQFYLVTAIHDYNLF